MVNKIGGPKRPIGPADTPVESTKRVQPGNIGDVAEVKGAEKKGKTEKIQATGIRITPQQKEEIFRMIDEEADKMFGPGGLPLSKRESVESAVKKTIAASMIEKEDEEKSNDV